MANYNRGVKLPPSVLGTTEIHALLAQFNTRYFTGMRDLTMIVIMWRSQLRTQEVLDLRAEDIDHDASTITVQHGKGDKFRVVGMDQQTSLQIREWQAFIRERDRHATDGRLFFCHGGKPVRPGDLRNKIRRLAKKAGITKRVHLHGLRHTGASELAREGVPIPVISQQLGHTSMVTTHRYLSRIAPQEVIAVMRRRIWRPVASSK